MRKLFASLLLACATLSGAAQTLLGGAEVTKKLPANFSAGIGAEYRSQDWFKHTDQWSIEASGSYKPIKPLKIALSYKFIQARTLKSLDLPAYWSDKHRVSLGVSGEWKPLGGLSLSLRERYQYTYRPKLLVPYLDGEGNDLKSAKSKHILRSRVQAEYKPYKKCRFTPYASFELYSLLGEYNHTKHRSGAAKFCDKFRVTAGSEFRINKKNSLALFYRYTHNADPDDGDEPHAIGLNYSFKF